MHLQREHAALIERTGQLCEQALRDPAFVGLRRRLQQVADSPIHVLAAAGTRGAPGSQLAHLREQCGEIPDSTFGRYVILEAAAVSTRQLTETPLPWSVKARICEQLQSVCQADASPLERYRIGSAGFERLWTIALLRRFPAGLFEWEVSGISRSDCLHASFLDWPRVGAFIAFQMRGFKPVFFSHLSRVGVALTEIEAKRSYYRMAMAMQQQPEILGFAACAWFRAPATHRVSPHLAWLSEVFQNNSGLVVDAGPDGPKSGALYRSDTRRALYESGQWVPRRGLVMWPRAAMLGWASRNPELSDPE